MPTLIARVPFRYGGRVVVPGEVFVARATDAKVLAVIGRARYAPDADTPTRRRTYKRRDVQPAQAVVLEAEERDVDVV